MGSTSHLIIGQKSVENARYYRRVLRKKIDFRFFVCGVLSICDNFWVQNHTWLSTWLSVKKVEKMFGEWRRNKRGLGLEHLWHFLGSKSRLIIGQKSRRGREGGRVLWYFLGSKSQLIIGETLKNMLGRGRGGLSTYDTILVHNPTKKSKKCSIL